MNEAYNFQGHIALPLEFKAREILELSQEDVVDTIFYATRITNGAFCESMLYLLRSKLGFVYDLSDFYDAIQP